MRRRIEAAIGTDKRGPGTRSTAAPFLSAGRAPICRPPAPQEAPIDIALRPLSAADPLAIERLLDATFGPERRGRTAYRLRAGATPIQALSTVALDGDGKLVGSLQSWDVSLVAEGRPPVPLVLVGPVAVAPELQGRGIGRAMFGRLTERADAARVGATVLIGDPDYYGRFGYSAAATGGWSLPGPFERHRLLARVRPGCVLPEVAAVEPASPPMRRAG